MNTQNHLQAKAEQLREKLRKQQEEIHTAKQLQAEKEADELKLIFSADFPELYRLLLGSEATIAANVAPGKSKKSIIISLHKQVEIIYEELTRAKHKWSLRGKDYLPTQENSQPSDLTDEEKLIVSVADALS
ncbi:hypothetical protein GXP67_07460 [Rhodocytophaga rosea]|uniref:Uncharacterized protein n=1 Tax=Rhodocytophaga rosea TaxID=2704465 RepID=A0A6C0GEU7_9BACT|nr:hypothetical protein [Rhodocytophaga rosea]QHT66505.1 hypothetical protein GXP67_07460 [Rhodocytophaga rosea]